MPTTPSRMKRAAIGLTAGLALSVSAVATSGFGLFGASAGAFPLADGATATADAGDAGTVQVTRNGDVLTVTSTDPAVGWTVEIERPTGREVELNFTNGDQAIHLEVELEDGDVTVSTDDDAVVGDDDQNDDNNDDQGDDVGDDEPGHHRGHGNGDAADDDGDHSGPGHDGTDDHPDNSGPGNADDHAATPATPAVPNGPGTPATPAIPATPSGGNDDGPNHDVNDDHGADDPVSHDVDDDHGGNSGSGHDDGGSDDGGSSGHGGGGDDDSSGHGGGGGDD